MLLVLDRVCLSLAWDDDLVLLEEMEMYWLILNPLWNSSVL